MEDETLFFVQYATTATFRINIKACTVYKILFLVLIGFQLSTYNGNLLTYQFVESFVVVS